jgi:aryl-alcohol dehydrogenase-like predicted oxidoreductase
VVSALGFGAWPIGGGMGAVEEATAITTIHAALDAGITLIDTSDNYRGSEGLIGRTLRGGRRARAFIATKVSRDYSPQAIRAVMENSLRELQTECVDLYQIHGWNPEHPIAESMVTMAALQREGKTRFIGVSNFNVEQMRAAQASAPFQTLQPRYNLFDRQIEAEIAPFCAREGIGILVHSPLGKGLLTGRYRPGHVFPAEDERSQFPRFQGETLARYAAVTDRLLAEVARPRGLSLVQLAVGWTLRLPAVSVCLVGAKSPDQVREHVGAQGWQLSEEELRRIDAILSTAPAVPPGRGTAPCPRTAT